MSVEFIAALWLSRVGAVRNQVILIWLLACRESHQGSPAIDMLDAQSWAEGLPSFAACRVSIRPQTQRKPPGKLAARVHHIVRDPREVKGRVERDHQRSPAVREMIKAL